MATHRKAALAVIAALLGCSALSGCIIAPERGGPYSYEHGDRVDHYGHREARWCDYHRDDQHCR